VAWHVKEIRSNQEKMSNYIRVHVFLSYKVIMDVLLIQKLENKLKG